MILIVSNDWGPPYEGELTGDSNDVELGYADMGKIDSELLYTPPRKTEFIKTGVLYQLVAVPA